MRLSQDTLAILAFYGDEYAVDALMFGGDEVWSAMVGAGDQVVFLTLD